MHTLVIYDSVYGNTQRIAEAIGQALGALVVRIDEVSALELKKVELLIVGSPVHGGRATPAIEEFIKSLPDKALDEKKVTAFDTRFAEEGHGIGLKILMRVIRFAAERMAKDLVKKGGTLITKPLGFIVENKTGPLQEKEVERAVSWAKMIESKFDDVM